MHFVLQTLSLQQLAEVKIVSHLWSQRDIFTQIVRLPGNPGREYRKKWKEIEENVKSKVLALPLPKPCKKQLLNFINPMRMEIMRWCCYHGEDFQYLDTFSPQQLRWTMHGTVDYTKTAELMVKDEKLDIERRYEIACLNCLEEEARELFQSMDEDQRQEYVTRVRYRTEPYYHQLILLFTCTFNDDVAHLCGEYGEFGESFLGGLFEDALGDGTRATCEYLFKNLNQREKDEVVNAWGMPFDSIFLPDPFGGCVSVGSLMFYLSLLNEEHQKRVFTRGRDVHNLLLCLLRWPLQSLFVEVAQYGWQFMDNKYRAKILLTILFNISSGIGDYDYCYLFWECWRLSPAEYKQDFLGNVDYLVGLLKTKEKDFILLVLNEAPGLALKRLVKHKYYDKIKRVLMDDSCISDAALTECKEAAALNSENDKENAGKRLRSQHLNTLIGIVMDERMKRRL